MINRVMVIKPDEEPEIRSINSKATIRFDQIREIIAGYIEPCRVSVPMETAPGIVHGHGSPVVRPTIRQGWVNEDGPALGQRGNSLASNLAGTPIVGTMVIELDEKDEVVMDAMPKNKRRGMVLGE